MKECLHLVRPCKGWARKEKSREPDSGRKRISEINLDDMTGQ